MGESIVAHLLIHFYHDLPRVDLTWTFEFQKASVGTFFDDESKLSVQWLLGFSAEIFHDIPFGMVRTRRDRPFFPTSWVDICDGERGLAFLHRGTTKQWVSDGKLVNLLGWGENTDAIHNGLGRDRWLKSFDQRLNGTHRIESAIFVHQGNWRTGGVAQAALAYRFPPMAITTGSHPGPLPTRTDILHLAEPDLISTAVFNRGEQIVCRVYNSGEAPADGSAALNGLRREGFHTIAGEEVYALAQYQIGELELGRVSR
jgi:hypothetical protein